MTDVKTELLATDGPIADVTEGTTDDQLIGMLVERARAEGLKLTGDGGLPQQLTKPGLLQGWISAVNVQVAGDVEEIEWGSVRREGEPSTCIGDRTTFPAKEVHGD